MLAVLCVSLVAAAEPGEERRVEPAPGEPSQAMTPLVGDPCTPPYRSSCPPRPGATTECAAFTSARSRDSSVRAEIVRDGDRLDLQAIHLVVRRGETAWIVREIGLEGVGCGTFDLFGASFDVHDLQVRDVLAGPAPEVILRYDAGSSRGGAHLLLCTTDVEPPRCASWTVGPGRLRFRRPDRVVSKALRLRVDLLGEDPPAI